MALALDQRILELCQAAALAHSYRRKGKTVVLTNGVFDLLHVGHVAYLERARAMGDVLFVGVNSDASTTSLKGSARPLVPAEERALLVSYLRPVDYVVVFHEATADCLLQALRPHVYVKGGDYSLETLPEAQTARMVGAAVRLVPVEAEQSTTRLVERILSRYR